MGSDDGDDRPWEVPSVDDVNVHEQFVPASWGRGSKWLSPIMRQVEVGGSLEAFMAGEPDASHREGMLQKAASAAMLSKSPGQRQQNRGVLVLRRTTDGKVGVLVRDGATARDVVLGVIQGRRLAARMSQHGNLASSNGSDEKSGDVGGQRRARQEEIEGECERWADGCIEQVMAAMAEAGWDTERVLIRSTMARFRAESAQ